MLPFLAESAPRPGRTLAVVAALAVVASLAMATRHHRPRHHEHHQLPRLGQCIQGYMHFTR